MEICGWLRCAYEDVGCVSLVLPWECVSCLSAWCVIGVVCVVHMGYVVFTYGCMHVGCVVCT